jgi:hypothetical protein
MPKNTTEPLKKETPKHSSYTMGDVFKITDDLFALSKEKEYHPGAFVHGLVFALEFAQQSYNIPQQQLAEIKRDCRRTVGEIVRTDAQNLSSKTQKK